MPSFKSLLEAGLFVESLSKARDFYEQVRGLEKLRESEVGCVFVVAKGQLLLLISREKARVPSKTPGGEVPPCVGGAGEILGAGHIAFAVAETELDVWRGHLGKQRLGGRGRRDLGCGPHRFRRCRDRTRCVAGSPGEPRRGGAE